MDRVLSGTQIICAMTFSYFVPHDIWLQRNILTSRGLCLGVSVSGISVQGGLCPGGGLWLEGSLSGGSLSSGSLSRGVSVTETPLYGGITGGTHPTGKHSCLSIFFQSATRWRFGWLFPWILIQTKLYFTRAGHVTTVNIYRFVMLFTNCQRTWLTGIFVSFPVAKLWQYYIWISCCIFYSEEVHNFSLCVYVLFIQDQTVVCYCKRSIVIEEWTKEIEQDALLQF